MNSDHSPDAAAVTVTPSDERREIALFSSILGLSTRFPMSGEIGERAAEPPRSPAMGFREGASVRLGLCAALRMSPVSVS